MFRSIINCIVTFVIFMLLVSCTDLQFNNPNEVPPEEVYAKPSSLETFVRSSFLAIHQSSSGANGDQPMVPLSVAAEENISANSLFGMEQVSSVPREPLPNNIEGEFSAITESAYSAYYTAVSAANDILRGIEEYGTGNLNETEMAKFEALGKFLRGSAYGRVALLYDQGVTYSGIFDGENPPELIPHNEVINAALNDLEDVIELTGNHSFIMENAVPGLTIDNMQLGRLAHSYIARFMAMSPRTPEERENVDWATVLQHLDQGIQEDYFYEAENSDWVWPAGDDGTLSDESTVRASYMTIGPADTSGAYENWLNTDYQNREPFQIETEDRRIRGFFPQSDGLYFDNVGDPEEDEGPRTSFYVCSRYADISAGGGGGGGRRKVGDGDIPFLLMAEMDMLRAEALWRQDPNANRSQIIQLIDKTRVGNGQLPSAADENPSNEELFEMIKYEKNIELFNFPMPGRALCDKRGWGDLIPGTFLHMPVPAEELLNHYGIQPYTHGGSEGDVAE